LQISTNFIILYARISTIKRVKRFVNYSNYVEVYDKKFLDEIQEDFSVAFLNEVWQGKLRYAIITFDVC